MTQPTSKKTKPDILIVDDQPENLRLLSQILSAQYKVRLAPSGEKGLDAVRSTPPDLILLDVMMPGLDGYEVASILKADEQTRDIPIIFISALGDVEDKVRGFAVGGMDYVTKPFQEDEILARVKIHLTIHALAQQLQNELIERKRSEEAFKNLVEHSLQAFTILQDEKFVFANREAEHISGYSRDELYAMTPEQVFALIVEEDRQERMQTMQNRLDGEELPDYVQFRITRKDGDIRWLESFTSVIDYQGKPAIQAAYIDITAQKRSEEALRLSEEKFRTVADWTYDWEYWINPQGKIVYMSPSCERVSGYTADEFITDVTLMERLIHPEHLANYQQHKAQHLETPESDESSEITYCILAKDGRERWIEHICRPVYAADGRYLGRRVSNRDVTERKHSEEAYENLVNNSLQALLVFQDDKVVFANPEVEHLSGYTQNELLAMSTKQIFDLIPAEDRDEIWQIFLARMSGATDPKRIEMRIIRQDGEIRWMESFAEVVAYRGHPAMQVAYIDITERRQAEEELRLSETRLKEAERIAQLGHWEFDLQADRLHWSDEVYRLFEVKPSEFQVSYAAFLELVHPDDRELVDKAYTESLRTKTPYSIDHRILLKDGKTKYVHEQCKTFYDANGNALRSIGTIQDINERIEFQKTLQESEELFRLITENTSDLIWIYDLGLEKFTYFSPSTEKLRGYSPEEVGTQSLEEMLTPESYQYVQNELPKRIAAFKAGDESEYIRTEIVQQVHKDGHIIDTEMVTTLLADDDRNTYAILGVSRNITERLKIEEELRKLSRAVEAAPVTVVITDKTGKIEYANPFFSEITGYTLSEALGENPRILQSGLTPSEIHDQLWKTLWKGQTWEGEFINKKKSGEFYTELAHISPVFDAEGAITHFVAIKQDITERKRAEEALRESEIRFRAIFDQSRDGIVLSRHGKFFRTNQHFAQMLGYKKSEELIGAPILPHIAPESRSMIGRIIEQRNRGEDAPSKYEAVVLDKIGKTMPVEVSSSVVQLDVDYTLSIVRDVSERKQAETITQVRLYLDEFSRNHTLDEVLRETLNEFCTLMNSPIGFFHFIEPDQRTISLQAWSTRTLEEFCTVKDKTKHYDIDLAGVWVDCVRQGAPVIHNDYASLPHRKGLPEGHAPVIREMVIPISRGQKVVAIIGVGNKAHEYTEENLDFATRLVDTMWDSIERKRIEEELLKSQQRYKLATTVSKSNVWEWTISENKIYIDANGFDLGYEADEQPTNVETFHAIIHPDDLQGHIEALDAHVHGKTPAYSSELRVIHKDGFIRWMQIHGKTVRDEQGIPLKVIGTTIDITERKHMEEELRISEANFREVFENTAHGIFINEIMENGEFRSGMANPASEAMTTLRRTNTDGKLLKDIPYPKDFIQALQANYQRCLDAGEPIAYEEEFNLPGAGQRFYYTTLAPVRDETGRFYRLIGSTVEITDRKKIEKREHEQRILAEALRDTAEALNSSLNLDEVLTKILDEVKNVVEYDAVSLLWIEEDVLRFMKLQGFGTEQEEWLRQQSFQVKDFLNAQEVLNSRKPIIISDTQSHPGWVSLPGLDWIRSHIDVPVVVDGKVVAVITLDSKEPGFYTEMHARNLQAFANQVAIAVHNAILFEEVQNLATVDELTSLYNRRGFFEVCRREVGRLQRFRRSFSMLFLDIDHFKQFNDRYSYEVGDQVLRSVAQTLQENVREVDVVGRYGGEEMIILLPEIEQSGAKDTAERLRRKVENLRVFSEQGDFHVTISIGVATLTYERGKTIPMSAEGQKRTLENLIAEAGEALHTAKRQGRNRVCTL